MKNLFGAKDYYPLPLEDGNIVSFKSEAYCNQVEMNGFTSYHNEFNEAIEFAGKSVGDKVGVESGIYKGNLFEYHVDNYTILHKFNAHTDDDQLNMDSILFPSEQPLQFSH